MSVKSVKIEYEGRPGDCDHVWATADIRALEQNILKSGKLERPLAGMSNPDLRIKVGRDFKLKFIFSEASQKKPFTINLRSLPNWETYIAKLLFEEGKYTDMDTDIKRAFAQAEERKRSGVHDALAKACAEKLFSKSYYLQGTSTGCLETISAFRCLVEMSVDYNYSFIEKRYLIQ